MLRDYCTVSSGDLDEFVGLKISGGIPAIIFPRGYTLCNDDQQLRREIVGLLACIRKFSGHREGDQVRPNQNENEFDFPILSYQYVIMDFLAHGYYTENEIRYNEDLRGKINWKKTIQSEKPEIDNDNVVYLRYITKESKIKQDSLITRIHEYCVYESFHAIGWLYLATDSLPSKPSITFNKALFLDALRKELNNTFNDRKRKLFQSMVNIVEQKNEIAGEIPNLTYGVQRFEYVWEGLIDYVFGEDDKEIFFPHAHWSIVSRNNMQVVSSELRPDTVIKLDGKIYILDAKYYKFGITHNPMHLPATDSIQKQITYGEYISRRGYAEPDKIFNAFVMPFKRNEGDLPYKFVSVGTADWKKYTEGTPNYNYVLGILLDTTYLIESYTRKSIPEIEAITQLIENSLATYRSAHAEEED